MRRQAQHLNEASINFVCVCIYIYHSREENVKSRDVLKWNMWKNSVVETAE